MTGHVHAARARHVADVRHRRRADRVLRHDDGNDAAHARVSAGELRARRILRNEQIIGVATLAAGTAHELSTPLGSIAVIASEMRDGATPEHRADIDLIVDPDRRVQGHPAAPARHREPAGRSRTSASASTHSSTTCVNASNCCGRRSHVDFSVATAQPPNRIIAADADVAPGDPESAEQRGRCIAARGGMLSALFGDRSPGARHPRPRHRLRRNGRRARTNRPSERHRPTVHPRGWEWA